jgi:hypothetical protein
MRPTMLRRVSRSGCVSCDRMSACQRVELPAQAVVPRGGILRTRTTVRLVPEDKMRFEAMADELGLSLTDTLAYYAALGAGLKVPVDIQKLIDDAARERANQPSLVA